MRKHSKIKYLDLSEKHAWSDTNISWLFLTDMQLFCKYVRSIFTERGEEGKINTRFPCCTQYLNAHSAESSKRRRLVMFTAAVMGHRSLTPPPPPPFQSVTVKPPSEFYEFIRTFQFYSYWLLMSIPMNKYFFQIPSNLSVISLAPLLAKSVSHFVLPNTCNLHVTTRNTTPVEWFIDVRVEILIQTVMLICF